MLRNQMYQTLNGNAHGKGKWDGAINLDGSIRDSNPKFSNKTRKWLREHGWKV